MRLKGSAEEASEGCLCTHWCQLKCWKDISVARGFPLRNVGSKPQAGLPNLQPENQERNPYNTWLWKASGFCLPGRHRDAESLLKGKWTKFCLQPLTLGSGRGRAKWTRDTWEEFRAGGSREKTEGTAAKIPALSHSLYCRSHIFQA